MSNNELFLDFLNENTPRTEDTLFAYGKDLLLEASNGTLRNVVGREKEIAQMIRILARLEKGNPLLIGDAGVGKTAIVEGLAQRMYSGDVPTFLRHKTIFSLDYTALCAGCSLKGQFEARVKKLVEYLYKSSGKVILFIDEIHNIIVSQRGDASMDLANILKPLLARGDVRVIGATTFYEYKRYIEKDFAFTRRLNIINVSEPTVQDTIAILQSITPSFERFHDVRVTSDIIHNIVHLTRKFIVDRYQPDKSIDTLDITCSKVRLEKESTLFEADELRKRILTLAVARSTIKNSSNPNADEITRISTEIEQLEAERNVLLTRWNIESQLITETKQTRKEIDETYKQIEKAKEEYDFNTIAILENVRLKQLVEKLQDTKQKLLEMNPKQDDRVTENDLLEVVADLLRMPKEFLSRNPEKFISKVKEILNKEIFGRNSIVNKVILLLVKRCIELEVSSGPIAVVAMFGKTGMGQSYFLKKLSESLYSTDENIISINIQELVGELGLTRFIGSSAGYLGYDDFNSHVDNIRSNPNSIILFENMQSTIDAYGYDNILSIINKAIESGYIRESHGKNISIHNSFIVFHYDMDLPTTNDPNEIQDFITKKLKASLGNTEKMIDDYLVFDDIDDSSRFKIANKIVQKYLHGTSFKHNVVVEHSIISMIAKHLTVDSMQKEAQKLVSQVISNAILNGNLLSNQKYILKYDTILKISILSLIPTQTVSKL